MLIDAFPENWLDELPAHTSEPHQTHRRYLLVDGAFVPGLHRMLDDDAKAILFESLPGCTDVTKDVSPFLTQFDPHDKALISLLRRCNRWPMISVIETPESLRQLCDRLAAWCVVESDGQRFNFRFMDTRRLPAIFSVLNKAQRAQFAGPTVRWSYISRHGHWRELEMDSVGDEIAVCPALDQTQFARLVDDSRGDELLMLLSYRGHDPYRRPSRSHELLSIALSAAADAGLAEDDIVEWCEWFWREDQLVDHIQAAVMLSAWRNTSS